MSKEFLGKVDVTTAIFINCYIFLILLIDISNFRNNIIDYYEFYKLSKETVEKIFPYIYNNSSGLRNFIYKTFLPQKKINILNTFEEFSPNVSGEKV